MARARYTVIVTDKRERKVETYRFDNYDKAWDAAYRLEAKYGDDYNVDVRE